VPALKRPPVPGSSPPSNRAGTNLSHPPTPRGRGPDRHQPVPQRRPSRRHRATSAPTTGPRPPHRTRPSRRPRPVGGPPQARAVRRRRMPGRRPRQTLQTMLHEAVHALAHARGSTTPPEGQVPQQARVRRPRRRARPGLARQPTAPPGDRLLRRAIDRAHRGRLRRHPDLSGCGHPAGPRPRRPPRRPSEGPRRRRSRSGRRGQQPTGTTSERFKVVCGRQPPRSFWIRARQYTPGPITCGICSRGQDFQPENAGHQDHAR
jgi:hypothetical protein